MCSVDWKMVLEYLKVFLSLPPIIFLVFITFLLIYKGELRKILENLKVVKFGDALSLEIVREIAREVSPIIVEKDEKLQESLAEVRKLSPGPLRERIENDLQQLAGIKAEKQVVSSLIGLAGKSVYSAVNILPRVRTLMKQRHPREAIVEIVARDYPEVDKMTVRQNVNEAIQGFVGSDGVY